MPLPADVAHLLRRAGFGASNAEVATLAAQPWATTVDQLLDFSSAPADVQPAYLTDPSAGDWEKEYQLQQWWLDRMATSTAPLQEKLTLFWHGHFATANYKVADMLLMYRQNALFRANATGELPRPRAVDVVAAGDAHLARQRPQREGQAERELRS